MEQRFINDVVLRQFGEQGVQVRSWNMSNKVFDTGLVYFDVTGKKFAGRVEVKYEIQSDSFTLSFWVSNGKHSPLALEKEIKRVYIGELVDRIDEYVQA